MAGETQILADFELLASLPENEREAVARRCSWRTYEREQQIIDRDSESRDVYFVVEGRVRVVNYSYSGREISFEDISPGEFFGELAAIDGQPRSAGVVAAAPSRVCIMPAELFNRLTLEYPEVSRQVILRLAAIVRRSTGRIFDLSTLGAQNRVQAELLRLARDGASEDGTAAIQPIPVHSEIASRVSTTRETVARVLSDLSREGLVERERNRLVINDIDELERRVHDLAEG